MSEFDKKAKSLINANVKAILTHGVALLTGAALAAFAIL